MILKNNKLQFFFLSMFLLFGKLAFAQPNPCHQNNIQPIGSCSEIWSITLSGTGDYNDNMCGWDTPGNEMVFQYTAVVTGVHSINISNLTPGVWLDFAWRLASSGCAETGWTCIDDVLFDGSFGAMNWTAGTTYYIIVDPEETDEVSFDFTLNCPTVVSTASECNQAISICSDDNFAIDPNGYGLVDEIPLSSTSSISNPSNPPESVTGVGNEGCLLSEETNSTWMIVNVLTAGTLEFSFGAFQTGGNYFDWAMWPYSPTACAAIPANTLAPVRCNWNGTPLSFTGIASDGNLAAMETTHGNTNISNNFAPELNVASNTQYVICFSNWSSAITTVPLNFFGTAGISCLPLGDFEIDIYGSIQEHTNMIQWNVANDYAALNYVVERRSESGEWIALGLIDVKESNGEEQSYSFADETPLRGENYYRVVQNLLNGSKKESAIISLDHVVEELLLMTTSPNPVNDNLKVKFSSHKASDVELQIVNLLGTVVYSENIQSQAGITINSIDVSQFASGTFLVQLIDNVSGEKQFARFVKN